MFTSGFVIIAEVEAELVRLNMLIQSRVSRIKITRHIIKTVTIESLGVSISIDEAMNLNPESRPLLEQMDLLFSELILILSLFVVQLFAALKGEA